MCGEKISVRPIRTGSPPPVRGKAGFPVRCREHSRITPACAGKSKSRPSSSSSSWDHPCVCGEKTKPVPAGGILMGSPPPVRGKVRKDSRSKAPCWDHPRVCGEKDMVLAMVRFVWGSPPRVRGKGGISGDCFFCPRITPACAGKRPGWADSGCQRGDHPRVCGEKCPPGKFFFMTVGSPPRMRGKAGRQLGIGGLVGITPAYAGKRGRSRRC